MPNMTSLIIATYNWPDALRLTLDSVSWQTVMPDEVVIADDGSREETRILIERFIGYAAVERLGSDFVSTR